MRTIALALALIVVIIIEGSMGALVGAWWLVPSFTAMAAVSFGRSWPAWLLAATAGFIGLNSDILIFETMGHWSVAFLGAGFMLYVLETNVIIGRRRSFVVRSSIFAASLLLIQWLIVFIQVGPDVFNPVMASRIVQKIAITLAFAWFISVFRYIIFQHAGIRRTHLGPDQSF